MTRFAVLTCLVCAPAWLFARAPQRAAGRAAVPKVSTAVKCAADLGLGVKSGRRFCDVIIAGTAADSIAVTIPAHRGVAKLYFDLHNRFALPPDAAPPAQIFTRNSAIVAVVGPKAEIGRGASVSEFRTGADLFDRIAGGGTGGVKSVGPGPATPIEMTIPAGSSAVGIIGVRLEVLTRLGKQTYDTPGRPVAIVSNLRVEYTALR